MWRGAFGNLVSGKDPRKPFVDAFADEQLLGFFKYYKIILEYSKHNIAGKLLHGSCQHQTAVRTVQQSLGASTPGALKSSCDMVAADHAHECCAQGAGV